MVLLTFFFTEQKELEELAAKSAEDADEDGGYIFTLYPQPG